MPEGERAFAESKGPRKKMTVLITADTYLLLKVAGVGRGSSATGQATEVLERWAADFLKRNGDQLRRQVAERRAGE